MADKENRLLLKGFILGAVVVLVIMMLFGMLLYSSTVGFHSLMEVLPASTLEQYGSTQAFTSAMLFIIAFVLSIGLLTLLTHGAMIKAAKKFIPGYAVLAVALFAAFGVAGIMVALAATLFLLVILYQFALKNVIFRTPASGPEEDIGSEGVVVERIDEDNAGRVKVGDTIWWARSSNGSLIEKGEKVRVDRVSGKKLVISVMGIPSKKSKSLAQRRCPSCGAVYPPGAVYCPECGSPLN